MGFWAKLLKREKKEEPAEESTLEPKVHYEEIPGTLDLGWYWSKNKGEFQMAKIAEKDRATHLYVIGATGAGKTKFLEFLIQQDIQKGNGFGVIDPHGDLVEDIKGFLACYHNYYQDEEIFDRVVLIDPTDLNFTVTFNLLEKLPNVSIAEQVSELVGAFKKIWSDSWGVRMEDLMRNSLIALGEAELTLAELPRFLTRRSFRQSVLRKVEHPIAKDYFERFDALTDRSQITWIEPVMNKINAFLADERIRQIFSSPHSSFNLRDIMDNRKILLAKLDKGKLKGSSDLLGSLLMAKIQIAAFSRSDTPQNKRTPFYLYIDEFQNFASESFAVLLSEARKYGLSLIMAHQTLSQVPQELKSLILGNAGIQVYFRVNREDASHLAREAFEYSGYEVKTFRGLSPEFWTLGEEWEHYTEELQNLPDRVCYAKHKREGGIIPIKTAEIEPAWEVLEMEEDEYEKFLETLPFGKKYLVAREELVSARPLLEEEPLSKEPAVTAVGERMEAASESEEQQKSQHRELQELIKRVAEEKGYQAVIEEPTPDGLGRVDVSIERNGRKIACEVCITSTDEQELSNIEKCLVAGYDTVVSCAPQRRILTKLKAAISRRLRASDKARVLFLQPEELFSLLEAETAAEIVRAKRPEALEEAPVPTTSDELWQERIWHALRHLDDRGMLNQSPLARLAYIQRLADREFRGSILVRGLALREVLVRCIDKIIAEANSEPGLQKTCEFLSLIKEGQNLTAIAEAMGLSREQVTRYHKKKAVELVTGEFSKLVKTRKPK
ncbi:type IV secretory system conjugative DNA transfer family protein [Dehalococcoidales bacterium]|nr:type IV secretory system conjugative DNA transfer family protein [Dehalococcoidales bacterium]